MYISLDIETTGFDIEKDRIIEIGAVKFKGGKVVDKFQTFLNPEQQIPEIITHITGISQNDTYKAPLFKDILEDLKKFVGKCPIIGHNIQFDIGFLRKEGFEIDNKTYDTFPLSQLLIDSPSHSLETLTGKLGITHEDKHRALDDAIACMYLLNILLEKIEEIPVPLLEEIKMHVSKSDWQSKDLFIEAKGGKEIETKIVEKEKSAKDQNVNLELVEKILDTFENEKNLLCEAGIGSKRKKSLLSAGAIQAKKNHERVVISVYSKDSAKELKELSDVATTILESHENYLSEKRLEDFKRKDRFEDDEITLLIKVLLWDKETGEKSELQLNREERVVFDEIACDLDKCDHSDPKTKEGCFFARMREKAIDSDIIITDHQFLLSEAQTQIPPYRYLIVDETDQLEKAGTQITTFVPEILEKKYPRDQVDMLFGLIGIFYEKYNEEGQFQLTLGEYHYRVVDWQKVCQFATNMSPDLAKIFTEDYSDKRVTWIFKNQEGYICLKSAKLDVKETLKALIETKKSVVLASSVLQVQNSFEYVRNTLGLYENFEESVYESKFSPEETITINTPRTYNQAKTIIDIAIQNEGKVAVLFTSQRSAEQMYKDVAPILKEKGITAVGAGITGGFGKVIDAFKMSPENHVIFGNWNFWESADLEEVNHLIITRLPFSPPSEPVFESRAKRYINSFVEYSLPQTLMKVRQAIYKLIKSNRGNYVVTILDSRVLEKDYGKIFLKSMPQN